MDGDSTGGSAGATFWDALIYIYAHDGVWFILLLGLAWVFYKLVWRVWSAAMKSKDAEIGRLVKERDFYQQKFFSGFISSDPQTLFEGKPEEPA